MKLLPTVLAATALCLGLNASAQDAAILNSVMSIGDHIYFTVVDQRGFETVRYNHTATLVPVAGVATAPVDRAQHNTARKSWPAGQCLLVLNTEGVLPGKMRPPSATGRACASRIENSTRLLKRS